MICSNCGSAVDGSKKYCHVCGYPVQPSSEVDLDATMAAPGPDYANLNNGEFSGGDFGVNGMPARPQPATPAEHSNFTGFEEKPKKKGLKKLLIPVVAIVLVAAIALGAWGIFLATNPEVKIARAIEKTLFKTKSFSFEISADGYDIAEGYVAFGKTTFTSDFCVEAEDMKIVCDDGQLLVPYGGVQNYAAFDLPELFAELTEGLDDVLSDLAGADSEAFAEELEKQFGVEVTPDQVAEWAETLIKNKTINENVIEEIWNTVGIPVASKYLEVDKEDIPDYDDIKSIIAGALTKGIKGDAFKVADTSKKSGVKYYECEVIPAELMKGVIEYALECKKLEAILEVEIDSDGTTLKENLEKTLEMLEDGDYPERLDEEVEFTVGIKDGYLVAVEYDELEVKIADINKKHDAKDDHADVEDDAADVEEFALDELIEEMVGGRKYAYEDDYYSEVTYNDYGDEYYYDDYYSYY